MLAAHGISVTYETIRQWGLKFGRELANRIRWRAPRRGDKWHLDEVVITIAGKKHWLWRAVDQEGFVLDFLVQSRRDKKAAKRLFRKLLKKQGRAPRVLITDKLKSYSAAKRQIMPGVKHRQHKGLNNRAENAHHDATTRADHEAVQVAAAGAAVSGHPSDRQRFHPPLQPRHRRDVSFRPQPSIHHLGRSQRNHACRRPAPHSLRLASSDIRQLDGTVFGMSLASAVPVRRLLSRAPSRCPSSQGTQARHRQN